MPSPPNFSHSSLHNIFSDYTLIQPSLPNGIANGYHLRIGPDPSTGNYETIRIDSSYQSTVFDSGAYFWYFFITRGVQSTAQSWWSDTDGTYNGVTVQIWDGEPGDEEEEQTTGDEEEEQTTGGQAQEQAQHNTKILFKNKPYSGVDSHHTYLPNNTDTDILKSADSSPLRYDKFTKNDLYTDVVGQEVNEAVIDSHIQYNVNPNNGDPLKYLASSFIRIDDFIIQNNDPSRTTRMGYLTGYIFDRNTYDIFNGQGVVKSASTIYSELLDGNYSDINPDAEAMCFYQKPFGNTGGGIYEIENMAESLRGHTILEDLNGENQDPINGDVGPSFGTYSDRYLNFRPLDIEQYGNNSDGSAFTPTIGDDSEGQDNEYTKIFGESDDGNNIYILFYMSGNQYEGEAENDYRHNRIQIFTLPKSDIFDYSATSTPPATPKSSPVSFNFETADGYDIVHGVSEDGGNFSPAYTILKLDVSINIGGSVTETYNPSDRYSSEIKSNVEILQFSNEFNLNSNTFKLNPNREIKTPMSSLINGVNELTDYIPVSLVNIKDINKDLQVYYSDRESRMIASSPTSVDFNFYISDVVDNKGELIQQTTTSGLSKYMFFVINWDDEDEKIKTWTDVLEDFPTNIKELLSKQNENLYHYEKLPNKLTNSYITPGIKIIKSVIFNYKDDASGRVEAIRWKLVTSRIFLDIPVTIFPDFGELGGADYTTIPWPYTTLIVGGISQDSKYLKSIDDTLGSGNIGNQDIIDEVFLVEAQENDELGTNIQKMDLEQVRYFNKSYDMNRLLNINFSSLVKQSQYFIDNPNEFPYYYEEFDIMKNGIINAVDVVEWIAKGRSDIAQHIQVNILLTDDYPPGLGLYFYNTFDYWDGSTPEKSYSEDISVEQIFIDDNSDTDLVGSCQLELNTGNLTGKSILDSSGKSNKGLLMGDYKIKKTQKNVSMRRDSFIKVPKKNKNNEDGAL
tara:strand:+ start:10 stop:2898 length:2889 start_codon:yes stop_codon:yes gene_type:complete